MARKEKKESEFKGLDAVIGAEQQKMIIEKQELSTAGQQAKVETTQAKVEANHLAVKQAKNTEAQGISQNITSRGGSLNDDFISNLIRPFGEMAGAGGMAAELTALKTF